MGCLNGLLQHATMRNVQPTSLVPSLELAAHYDLVAVKAKDGNATLKELESMTNNHEIRSKVLPIIDGRTKIFRR